MAVEHTPEVAKEKDNEGSTPLPWLLTQDTPSRKLVTKMLKLDMPIDLDSGSSISHNHSWSKCLASSKKGAVKADWCILDPDEGGYSKHINKLVQVLAEKLQLTMSLITYLTPHLSVDSACATKL